VAESFRRSLEDPSKGLPPDHQPHKKRATGQR
jgi:hypothetical protein